MSTVSLEDATVPLSRLVDNASKGEFVTITRHGMPVAALVSLIAAEIARNTLDPVKPGLVAHLKAFPGVDVEPDRTPSRDVDL